MPMSKLPKCSGTFGNAVPQPTELITSTSASVLYSQVYSFCRKIKRGNFARNKFVIFL